MRPIFHQRRPTPRTPQQIFSPVSTRPKFRQFSSSNAPVIQKFELKDNKFLRVFFGPGSPHSHSDFHFFWLRHNCNCLEHCRHPKTNERVVDPSEFELSISPQTVSLADPHNLDIVWKDPKQTHPSRYTSEFLLKHSYAPNHLGAGEGPEGAQGNPTPSSFFHPDLSLITLNYPELKKKSPDGSLFRQRCLKSLKERGLVIVKQRGMDSEELLTDFLPPGKDVVPSHFGRWEDLRTDNKTNQNTDQLGYTNAPVQLHTDQPFINNPPPLQLLHCLKKADVGGDNFFVDGFEAARCMAMLYPMYYALLTLYPVCFHRKQKSFESIVRFPIINLDPATNEPKQIRYSYFTFAPHHLPFEVMEHWYRAYNTFALLVRNTKHQYRSLLEEGDFVVYDNFRVLHAREGFEGARHLRGIYLEREDVYSRLAN